MQVILLEKVLKLGDLGDVVRVKDGYARNYLIPQGKAKRANEANMAEFEARRAELERAQAERLAAAQAIASQLEGLSVQVARKAGMDGRLFGSVGNSDVSEALAAHGLQIERSLIRLPQGPLKQVGEVELEIALHPEVTGTVTVAVVADH